jgi:YceI-like domain.
MKILIAQILLLFAFAAESIAQTIVSVDLQKNSYLTINGSTNITPFKLIQGVERFPSREIIVTTTQDQNKIILQHNQITLAVKNFTSDNKMALHDFLKLVKSDIYPNLQIEVNYLTVSKNPDKDKLLIGNASVNITIIGVTRKYTIPISSNKEGSIYILDGKKKMSIRDFGLVPPVHMMGLIKVSEWINIDFHMIFKISAENTAILHEKGFQALPPNKG